MQEMKEASTRKIYDLQSSFYDRTFARLVVKRVEKAIREHMSIGPNDVVLDMGIGTGASLDHFPGCGRIVGIDLSEGMLDQCVKKIHNKGITNVTLFRGNALELPFADSAFDHIFISHVISVVSDPVKLLREAQRVAKPGARIVIVNHFRSANPIIAAFEKWLNPFFTKIGWRSDLALQDLIKATGIEVDYRFKLESIDLWETVVIRNAKSEGTSLPVLPSAAMA
jgi:phosphatidylethanolamine/phosphatidyl-N-methylethanolamine N-methyltransferase